MESSKNIKYAVINAYDKLPKKTYAARNFGCTEGHFRNIARPDKDFPESVYTKAMLAIEKASKQSFLDAKKIHDETIEIINNYRKTIEITVA